MEFVVEDIKHNHVQVNSEWFEVCEFVEYFISFLRYSVWIPGCSMVHQQTSDTIS